MWIILYKYNYIINEKGKISCFKIVLEEIIGGSGVNQKKNQLACSFILV